MKRKAKQKGDSQLRNRGVEADSEVAEHYALRLVWCQRILRALYVAMMVSILLIIGMTTASTGVFVQVTAKALYHLILLSALVSLATWMLRVRLERILKQDGAPSSEVVERT
mgnify:CR=1 FL=1